MGRSMMSREPGFYEVRALKDWPRADLADDFLRDIAEAVTPIMSRRGLDVDFLEEFYPEDEKTLGSLKAQGRAIQLRVRDSRDYQAFQSFGLMVDAVLHELARSIHHEYGGRFQELWDELRHEHLGDHTFRGVKTISVLPDPSGPRAAIRSRSVTRSTYSLPSRGLLSTARAESIGTDTTKASLSRGRLSRGAAPSFQTAIVDAGTSRGHPPPPPKLPQSKRGRSQSRTEHRPSGSCSSRDVRLHVHGDARRAVSSAVGGSVSRPCPGSSGSVRAEGTNPPSIATPSSRAPSRGSPERRISPRPSYFRGPPERRYPGSSYCQSVAEVASTRSSRSSGLPFIPQPSSSSTRKARPDDQASSVRSWAESVRPDSRLAPEPSLPIVRNSPQPRSPSHTESHCHSRVSSVARSARSEPISPLSELMPAAHSNYERELQRRGAEWRIRELAQSRQREATERAARERQEAEIEMYRKLMHEQALTKRELHDHEAVQQLQQGMAGMVMSVNQLVAIGGGQSISGPMSMDGGKVVYGSAPRGCFRTMRRSEPRRSYSSGPSGVSR